MHAKTHLAAKSDENIIVEGQRSIKAAQKDPSTTVVASIRLTGATVVGSTNLTEFWQRRTQPPSFLLLLSRKMDLAILQWSTLRPGSQMIYYNYHFCDNYFCTCFLPSFSIKKKTQTKLRLFHGCSNKIKVGEGSKIKNWRKNGNYDWLFGYLMEAKITMELWESEIRAGPFQLRLTECVCVCGGGGGCVLPPLPDLFFCYAFERMNTSKMIQIEKTGGKVFFFLYLLCIMY